MTPTSDGSHGDGLRRSLWTEGADGRRPARGPGQSCCQTCQSVAVTDGGGQWTVLDYKASAFSPVELARLPLESEPALVDFEQFEV